MLGRDHGRSLRLLYYWLSDLGKRKRGFEEFRGESMIIKRKGSCWLLLLTSRDVTDGFDEHRSCASIVRWILLYPIYISRQHSDTLEKFVSSRHDILEQGSQRTRTGVFCWSLTFSGC